MSRARERMRELGASVEEWLRTSLDDAAIPHTLADAMRYSLLAGGKRLRPVLCLASGRMLGAPAASLMPFACALEFIHTYSLIHDDLPAMDNDLLRRGKPTSHVVHGEALAILAGDALLTEAFGLMASAPFDPALVLRAISFVSVQAGARGMVGGQTLDMAYTGRQDVSLQELAAMHAGKTGALLRAACVSGAILAGAGEKAIEALRVYGDAFGFCFQITDDILDEVGDTALLGKNVGSDQANGKTTYPLLAGLEKSREMAREQAERAAAALKDFSGPEADFLRELARSLVDRVI